MSRPTIPLPLLALVTAGSLAAQDQVRITEWMYKGNFAEFFEITNLGAASVDLTGWSMDDKSATPGTLDLSPLGTLAAGESAVVTETDSVLFATEWGLIGVKILGGNLTANLGRNDEIHLFDAQGLSHDVLAYGDQDFPGTPRADGASANVCTEAVGANYVWSWTLSSAGDAWGSAFTSAGDTGNPGSYTSVACDLYLYCSPNVANSTGEGGHIVAIGDPNVLANDLTLVASSLPANQFGYFLASETQGLVQMPPGAQGDLCLGGNIARFRNQIVSSGDDGTFSIQVDLTSIPVNPPQAVLPGDTWNFQAWYRDVNPVATSNFTNAVSFTFE